MAEENTETGSSVSNGPADMRSVIREVITEFVTLEQTKAEPAYKAELVEERKRREQLELRVNELVRENRQSRAQAEEAERGAAIRSELQKLGVAKLDLAYRAVKDDIVRNASGQLAARGSSGDTTLGEYLRGFVNENPELLPARITGASGVSNQSKPPEIGAIDIDRIKPGMSQDELEKVRKEVARLASQAGVAI